MEACGHTSFSNRLIPPSQYVIKPNFCIMSLTIIKEIITDQSTLIGVYAGYHLMMNGMDNEQSVFNLPTTKLHRAVP